MKAYICRQGGELGKFECISRSFAEALQGRVLDVGSRTGNLKRLLAGAVVRYTSLDLAPRADVIASLDHGLPFADRSFDVVVALDVLEHTNLIHFAFGELLRVANRHVIVTLPNAFDVKGRLLILRGRHISGKYGLPIEATLDRHRWFFSFDEARRFCEAAAAHNGWVIREQGVLIGPKRGRLSPLVLSLPNLLAPSYLGWLQRPLCR